MKKAIFLSIILIGFYSCKVQNSKKENRLIDYLETQSKTPSEYIIEKFNDHDIIFVGENHYIKQQVEFISNLIPILYNNGIYNLGTEFLSYENTYLVNKLITDSIYNEKLAEEISFNSEWDWGYKEYLDIYKKAWELNKSLPKNAKKFKIFGIQEVIDYSFVKKEEDLNNPEIMNKVFTGSTLFDESEGYSANAIQKEVLDINEKALIHCGIHHAFTLYYQPSYNSEKKDFGGSYEKERMGNLIKNKIGNRTMTIFLHGPWYSKDGYNEQVLPVDGVLDSLFSIKQNKKFIPFGVDTKDTPFGDLKGENSVYKYGYPNFKLRDFCDGYIFLVPIKEYKTVSLIENFIKSEQVEYVKNQEFDFRELNLTAKDLNDTIKVWLNNELKNLKKLK